MKLILFIKEDLSVGIINVGPNVQQIELIAQVDVPKDSLWTIIDDNMLPKDQFFRGAWIWKNERIEVDLEAAKKIKRDQFRMLREPLFPSLDLDFMRAVENQDLKKQREIAAKKQALRDVTAIDMPEDLNELKNFIPKILQNSE